MSRRLLPARRARNAPDLSPEFVAGGKNCAKMWQRPGPPQRDTDCLSRLSPCRRIFPRMEASPHILIEAVRAIGGYAATQRIANLTQLIDTAPPDWRGRIVRAAGDPSLRVSLAA